MSGEAGGQAPAAAPAGDDAPQQRQQQHADVDDRLDRLVQEHSKAYSIDKWLQPRSMVQVQLAKLKEETRCPMCFGKIRQARISMVCLHRYCTKCIEQYLRAKVPGRHGDDKECPVCRAHLHSRRATKPDPVFDRIITALYGDVDAFDAEEEALIAEDNKAHVAAWQAQLADLKARQAAATAAARLVPPPPPSSSLQQQPGPRLAAGKRSYGALLLEGYLDDEGGDEDDGGADGYNGGRHGRSSGGGGGGGRPPLSKAPHHAPPGGGRSGGRYDDGDDGWRGGGGRGGAAAAGGGGGSRRPSDGDALSPRGSMGSGGGRKKKRRAREVAARLLGLAAQAAEAAPPPPRMCIVHLVPATRLHLVGRCDGAADGAAVGRPEGRSRKQHKGGAAKPRDEDGGGRPPAAQRPQLAAIAPGQVACPTVDQPFLACPFGLTVQGLKQLLLQQLRRQGTLSEELAGTYELQVLQPSGAGGGAGGSGGGAPGSGTSTALQDDQTVGQLHEASPTLGPDLLLSYQLLGV